MSRLEPAFLERLEAFAERIVRVASALAQQQISRRIVDQLMACGTAVGANAFEADEAMSRRDFIKCLAISNKELNEARFWLRLAIRSDWLPEERLGPLLAEADEIRRILGTMIARSKARPGG